MHDHSGEELDVGVEPASGLQFGEHVDGGLLDLFDEVARPEDAELIGSLLELAAEHTIPPPNVDLGLAAMAWATHPATRATVKRTWPASGGIPVAHYLEELEERPLRFRARAIYAASHRD